MTAEPVRIAIVGTGNIARSHARAITSQAEAAAPGPATIVAAMDVDQSQLGTFCAEFHIPGGYGDLATLLSQARPDLVHICTPPSTHHPIALDCLRGGASVLSRSRPRSACGSSTSSQPPERRPPWFATVFQHRFGAGQRRLKALAASGALGRPLVAVCHTTWFRDQAYFDVPWRGRWDTEGGGPTMGHGIHQMDMLLDVLGDWTEVSAIARTPGQDHADRGPVAGARHVRERRGGQRGEQRAVPAGGVLPAVRLRARDRGGDPPVRLRRRRLAGHPGPWLRSRRDGGLEARGRRAATATHTAVTPPSSPACSPRCATAGARR